MDLEKKKKDLEELERMDKIYNMDELEYVKDRVRCKIQSINTELLNIKDYVGCSYKNFIL